MLFRSVSQSRYGVYRVALLVYRGSVGGGLQYKLSGDNGANGNWDGSTTIPTVGTSNIGSGGYWQIKTAPGSATADLGYWVRIHFYIKRPVLSYVRSSSIIWCARSDVYSGYNNWYNILRSCSYH